MVPQLVVHDEVRKWLDDIRELDRLTAALIAYSVRHVLEGSGPDTRPPLVCRIKGSRVRRLSELCPPASGRLAVRILFAFDQDQRMVLLVAGDQVANWKRWHRDAVPLAEERFADYLDGQEGAADDG